MRLLLVVLLAACGPRTNPESPVPDEPEEPAPAPDDDRGELTVTPQAVDAGESVTVDFDRPGRNGCYRQTDVQTEVVGQTITHSYTTRYEGDICTQALVPGGFETQVTLEEPGTYEGRVVVDGEVVATYEVTVT